MATRRHKVLLAIVLAIVLAAVLALVFGPARGMRHDIGQLRADQDHSRVDIHHQLLTLLTQLTIARRSLDVQRQGLTIASQSQHLVGVTARNTDGILADTNEALKTVRQALAALQPLHQLGRDVARASRDVGVLVQIGKSALSVARATLRNGTAALDVARRTLATLQQSRDIQRQLLDVARKTLQQTRRIDRKIPTPPVFPAAGPPARSG